MLFEYDPAKSAANLRKHGIDFEDAQAVWDDPYAVDFRLGYTEEPRWMVVGRAHAALWPVVVTYRGEGGEEGGRHLCRKSPLRSLTACSTRART